MSDCEGFQRSDRPPVRALGYLCAWLYVSFFAQFFMSCSSMLTLSRICRLHIHDVPAVLFELLQGPLASSSILPSHVE